MTDLEYIKKIADNKCEVMVFVDNEHLRTYNNADNWQRNEFIELCSRKIDEGFELNVNPDEDEIYFNF